MSTPFAIFRRNQKALIAFLGVMLIFVFTVGSIVLDFFDVGRAPRDNKVIVEWQGGKITASEMERMQVSHNLLVAYLDAVIQETVSKKGTPKAPGLQRDRFGRYVAPGIRRSASESDIVLTMVLAKKARDEGLVVSDEAIDSFLLRQLGDEMIGSQTMTDLLETTTRGQIRQKKLYDLLKTELLAQNLQILAQSGLFATPPAEAWRYYNQLNRRVVTEMLPIPVDAFLDQVPEPAKAEILALYEERKGLIKSPETPEPGFKRGDQIKFGYFRSNMDDFKSQLTEEEIVAYYEENKEERFKNLTLPENPAENPATEGGASPEDPNPEKPVSEKPVSEKPVSEKPVSEDGDKSKDAETAKESKPTAPPQEEKPPTEKSVEKPAEAEKEPTEKDPPEKDEAGKDEAAAESKEEAAKPESSDGAARVAGSQRFVAFRQDDKTKTDDAAPDAKTEDDSSPKKEAGKDDTKEKAPPQTDAAAKPEEKPAEAPPQKPATVPPANGESEKGASRTETPPAEESAGETEPAEKPVYKPLEEVRSQIENALAQQKAAKAFDVVGRLVAGYARSQRLYQAKKNKKQAGAPPQKLDFTAIAKENGLTYGETPLADRFAIEETELGKTFAQSFSQTGFVTIPFVDIGFQRGVPLYKTSKIGGERFTEYLFWKIAEKEAYIPTLEEVRDEVVAVWKMRQALPLAKKFAQEIAREAAKQISLAEKDAAKKDVKDDAKNNDDDNQESSPEETAESPPTLTDVVNVLIKKKKPSLGELPDLAPPPFSWMTTGAMPYGFGAAPELSSVEGVYGVDDGFMEDVFALHVGEVGVAVNHPKTVVYLTRITSETPPEDQRRVMFTFSAFNPNTQQLASRGRFATFRKWYQEVEKNYGVKWNRPADQEEF